MRSPEHSTTAPTKLLLPCLHVWHLEMQLKSSTLTPLSLFHFKLNGLEDREKTIKYVLLLFFNSFGLLWVSDTTHKANKGFQLVD